MTCSKVALTLSVLGTVGVGVVLSMGVAMGRVILYGGRLHFRSIRWRSILVGLLAHLSGRHRAVGALLRIPG